MYDTNDPLGTLICLFYDLDSQLPLTSGDIAHLLDTLFAIPALHPLLSTPAATQYGIAGIILSHRSPQYHQFWREQLCPAWNARAQNLNCVPVTEKQ